MLGGCLSALSRLDRVFCILLIYTDSLPIVQTAPARSMPVRANANPIIERGRTYDRYADVDGCCNWVDRELEVHFTFGCSSHH